MNAFVKKRPVSFLCCNGEVMSYWATVITEGPAKWKGVKKSSPLWVCIASGVMCDERVCCKWKKKYRKEQSEQQHWTVERQRGYQDKEAVVGTVSQEVERKRRLADAGKLISVKRGNWSKPLNVFSAYSCVLGHCMGANDRVSLTRWKNGRKCFKVVVVSPLVNHGCVFYVQ